MAHEISDVSSQQRSTRWLLGLGILFIVLGLIGLGMTASITIISVLFFGILLIVAGISQIIDVFKSKHWHASLWHILVALCYLIAGGIFIYDPLLASTILTSFIASILIVIGVFRVMMAFSLRENSGWGWILLAGLIAIALGGLILAQWPWSGLWVIGMFIAIDLLIAGWTYILLALALKNNS